MRGARIVGLTLALSLSFGAAGCRQKAAKPAAEETAPAQQPEATGPPVAVEIVAYYPLNPDHQYIVDYLREFEDKYPGEVRVTVHDMQTPEGRERWRESGLGCAGVFVNGSTRHELKRDGETATGDFIKRMAVFWLREDFEAVVEDLLKQDKPQE